MPETNDFKSQLKEIKENDTLEPNKIEAYVASIADSATSLDGFDTADLAGLASLVKNLPNDSSYKERVGYLIAQKLSEFASYSLVARHNELTEKGNTISADELSEKAMIENFALRAVSECQPGHVSPNNAVALSDYLKIAESFPDVPEEMKENITQINTNVDKALKEFDDINDILRFEGISPEEMDDNEAAWLEKANEVLQNVEPTEEIQIFTHLAAQHLKDRKPGDDAQGVLLKELEDIKDQYNEVLKAEIIKQGAYNRFKADTGLDDKEIADLQLRGDAGLLEDEEQKKQYAQLIKTREDYLKKYIDEDINAAANGIALKEIAADEEKKRRFEKLVQKLKADPQASLTEEEAKLSTEYQIYSNTLVAAATETTKVAFAYQIENLACRTAKITGAKDITKSTKSFLQDFAQKHPKTWMYGKCIALGGAKAAIGWGIGAIAGANGLAVYSAYNTYQAYRKAYKQFQEKTGQTGFKNFVEYLKKPENSDTKINLIRSLATTGVAVGFAVAGNVTGLSALPVYKQATNAVVNMGANIAKAFNHVKDLKNKHPKKFWTAVAALGVTTAITAISFLPDSVKEKVSDWAHGILDNDNTPDPMPEPDDAPLTSNTDDINVVQTNGSGEHFDIDEAKKGIENAGKINPELTKEIDPLRQSYSQSHAPHVSDEHNIEETPVSPSGSNDGKPEEIPEIPKEKVSYEFNQKSGGIFSHNKVTLTADEQAEFKGNTMEVPARMEGETREEYIDRVVKQTNADINENSNLAGEEYHAKMDIKAGDEEIHVKQEVDYSNKNHLETVRRKIEFKNEAGDGDSYSSKTKVFRDDDNNVERIETKYRSHQVDSNTVGEDGGKADKLLRTTTVADENGNIHTAQLYKDGTTGDKILRVTDENGAKDYAVQSGGKKVMKAFINARGDMSKLGGDSR